ncbi:hypothetical protein BT93_F3118 [Corymbia citriodora subsp. variegata]|nr:hypothetical protein BT93_F3118 [Corymbia citriodora subsp. variegata]
MRWRSDRLHVGWEQSKNGEERASFSCFLSRTSVLKITLIEGRDDSCHFLLKVSKKRFLLSPSPHLFSFSPYLRSYPSALQSILLLLLLLLLLFLLCNSSTWFGRTRAVARYLRRNTERPSSSRGILDRQGPPAPAMQPLGSVRIGRATEGISPTRFPFFSAKRFESTRAEKQLESLHEGEEAEDRDEDDDDDDAAAAAAD